MTTREALAVAVVALPTLTAAAIWLLPTRSVRHAAVVAAIATGALMIRMEDAELEERFGEEFLIYRSKVPAILPYNAIWLRARGS